MNKANIDAYFKKLDKAASKFKLTQEDLRNFYDFFFMIDDWGTIDLNGLTPWAQKFHYRIMSAVDGCSKYEEKNVK